MATGTPEDARRTFLKEFRALCSNRWNAWDVWSDWLVMASSAIYNAIHHDQAVEDEYMRAVKRYSTDEAAGLARLLAITVQGLEAEPHDFLGSIFHELELHNEARGQFFTPYSVCRMMASMASPDPPGPGLVLRVGEPACGSGAMVIAFHQAIVEKGGAPERILYELRDLDDRAFRMAYIQCSLLGLAAEVQRGNTLTLKIDLAWRTPGYYLHDMPTRLRVDSMMRAIHGDDDAAAIRETIHAENRGEHHSPGGEVPAHNDPDPIRPGDGPAAGRGRPAMDPLPEPEGPESQPAPTPMVPDLILPRPGENFSLF